MPRFFRDVVIVVLTILRLPDVTGEQFRRLQRFQAARRYKLAT